MSDIEQAILDEDGLYVRSDNKMEKKIVISTN
ncbi:hypothetical protein SAMN05428962_5575 [Paenibacillus sp. BC26]|nr:hypothetical protein SAMN05428962_5575 [Paenibacillus sp. BC26]